MRLRAALPLCAALLSGACIPRRPPPDLSLDPVQLASQVRAAQAPLLRVEGEMRLHLEAPRSAVLRQFAAAELPDRVHLEALDFFGNPAAVLVTAGGRFSLYEAEKKILYRGAATPENLARLVPVPMTADVLAAMLLGTAPLPAGAPASVEPDGAQLRLRYEEGGAILDFWIGEHALVEKMVRSVPADPAAGYQVEFWGHTRRGGGWFPGTVALRGDRGRVRLAIKWTQVEVNGPADPGLFAPPAPKGARIVDVDAGEG